MKTMFRTGGFVVALALGAAGAWAQTNPGIQPLPGKGQPKATPAPKAAPMHAGPQVGPMHDGPQAGPMHAGQDASHPSMNSRLMRPHVGTPRYGHGGTMRQPGYAREFIPRPAYGVPGRSNRAAGYARPYNMRPQRLARYGENPASWSPRYGRTFARGEYDYRRTLRYGYAPRPYGYVARPHRYGPRPYAYARGYGYRRSAYSYAPRFSYYGYSYRPRVRYAYAETPYAYDLPRETYATGIFATNAALGLHSYDYAYTTQVRPIAAYGGLTGSYAGAYPIYNRPLAPAYPTPRCDCEY